MRLNCKPAPCNNGWRISASTLVFHALGRQVARRVVRVVVDVVANRELRAGRGRLRDRRLEHAGVLLQHAACRRRRIRCSARGRSFPRTCSIATGRRTRSAPLRCRSADRSRRSPRRRSSASRRALAPRRRPVRGAPANSPARSGSLLPARCSSTPDARRRAASPAAATPATDRAVRACRPTRPDTRSSWRARRSTCRSFAWKLLWLPHWQPRRRSHRRGQHQHQ